MVATMTHDFTSTARKDGRWWVVQCDQYPGAISQVARLDQAQEHQREAGDLRKEWQAQRMRIEEWWPKLDPATQEWLIANNGDVVPTTVLGQIAEAGGDVTSDASSIGDNVPGGLLLSDAAVDWIEETANHEADSDG